MEFHRSESNISEMSLDSIDSEYVAPSQTASDTCDSEVSSNKKRPWIYQYNVAVPAKDANNHAGVQCTFDTRKCKIFYLGSSTSNMIRHLKNKHHVTKEKLDKGMTRPVGPFDLFVCGGMSIQPVHVSRELWREQLTRFVVSTNSPFKIVENEEFKKLIQLTQEAQSMDVVAPITANIEKSDITRMYQAETMRTMSYLQAQQSLSFSTDAWTSEWGVDFIGITAHFIDDNWIQREVIIGFEHPEERHSGEALASHFLQVLRDFGISHLLFTITADNASNNGKMAKEIEKRCEGDPSIQFKAGAQLIPCVGHVINLAAQVLIKDGLKTHPYESNGILDPSQLEVGQDVNNIISKVRVGMKKIRLSTTKYHKQYNDICRVKYGKELSLIMDVCTRWNSTHAMIERLLRVREAYNATCNFFSELSCYRLEPADEDYLCRAVKLLESFKFMTDALSTSKYPSINKVIFAYNVLLDDLEDFQADGSNPSMMRQAASHAQEKLQQYYSRTDASNVYAVATVLDPSLKEAYWTEQNWEDEHISVAKEKVAIEWANFRVMADEAGDASSNDRSEANSRMDRYNPSKRARIQDELAAYTSEPTLPGGYSGMNPELEYWRRTSSTYLQLSKMARKFLAVLATSTSCECLFSGVRGFVPSTRASLSSDALKESVTVKAWLNVKTE